MRAKAIAQLEADSIDEQGVVALVWCYNCPLNKAPADGKAYVVTACGDTTITGEHCKFWEGYHIDKNRQLIVGCMHPKWTHGPGVWIE